ncbi:MAG: cell division FtsZ family protein [Verrucomicrobia bacterium]|nr:cell division FtsZ family protein [Verrucomicrobiota bacterium]MBV8481343.1 cell division FtsZ family protein [Verrucomicrobiota bacterium]
MVQLNSQYGREENTSETRKVRVIGVGGAGSNILDRAMLDGIDRVELATANTDVQSLTGSVTNLKIQLGRNLTRGLGSGGDPELGLAAAEECSDEIQAAIAGYDIVFVCAGLGGGTGSGAAPYIAKLAKDAGALVLALVTMPFTFEGRRRCAQAAASLQLVREYSDAVICFENDRMAELALPRMGIHEAFAAADVTISQSIRAMSNLLLQPGLIRLGFDDICSVIRDGDARALFGFGEAEGENRAHDALVKALRNPLMHRGEMLASAVNVIVQIRGGANVNLGEIGNVMEELNRHVSDRTQLMMGIAIDSRMGSRLSVSLISSLGGNPERLAKADYPALEERERLEPAPTPTAAALPEPVVHLQLGDEPSTNGRKIEVPPSEEAVILESAGNRPSGHRTSKKEVVPADKAAPKAAPKKIEAKQEVLQFDAVSRGRFEKSEPTIIDGQDLDVPTFLRRRVKVG